MGILGKIFKPVKIVSSSIFKLDLKKALNVNQIKDNFNLTVEQGKKLFTVEEAGPAETFEEALSRLNLTEEDLITTKKQLTKLMVSFLVLSIIVFIYTIVVASFYGSILSLGTGIALTCLSIVQFVRYHFWLYQIKKRKLGCSLKEWWNDSIH